MSKPEGGGGGEDARRGAGGAEGAGGEGGGRPRRVGEFLRGRRELLLERESHFRILGLAQLGCEELGLRLELVRPGLLRRSTDIDRLLLHLVRGEVLLVPLELGLREEVPDVEPANLHLLLRQPARLFLRSELCVA